MATGIAKRGGTNSVFDHYGTLRRVAPEKEPGACSSKVVEKSFVACVAAIPAMG